ncbi:hypothetical protein IVB30_37645 [Bradyrhizobium sp. 200]|uniref:hypothetical protein n=1 Tax=Bradyrhizobium sp. 200 TaxID=2782665 RepID=UPI001FFE8F9F|nr:hypothetical protein [Bradyrhizobium sp. 200]UPJ48689.1 hypothetical protein IVB30_37645 [Bradyrhizobium sp. 200]
MADQSETNTTAASQPVPASDAEPAEVKATPETLTAIIKLLEPLSSAQRQRTVAAAMMFLGEAALQKPRQEASAGSTDTSNNDDDGETGYAPQITKWMKQNDVSAEELDRVFHFNGDGTFDLLHAPGKTKKEQTVNTYILTGLGKYLAANDRSFDDATARSFCETIGCFDATNHATYLRKNKGGEFTGDKTKGYSLTNVGVKRGAVLVKELAGG